MPINWLSILVLIVSLVLSGCRSPHHPIEDSDISIPGHWSSTATGGNTVADHQNFWELFNDPKLNQLIDDVLSINNDLALATLTLKKFQTYKDNSVLEGVLPKIGTVITAKTPSLKNYESATLDQHIVFDYEIDLLGTRSADRNMKAWEVKAVEQDRQAVALNLIASTATVYWKIALLKQAIEIYQNQAQEMQKILDLTYKQFQAGSISKSAVLSAEKNLADLQLEIEKQKESLTKSQHSMALLFNRPPQQVIEIECDSLESMAIPEVVTNVPAKIIETRPDIRAAKNRVHKALIGIQRFGSLSNPVLSIPGLLAALLGTLSNPMNLGAVLQWPIIVNWDNQPKIAKIQYEESIIKYRDTVYQALLEIEDLLSSHNSLQKKSQEFLKLHAIALELAKIAKKRHLAGAISLKDCLLEQSQRFLAKLNVIQNKFYQLTNTMSLYQALGGKFQLEKLDLKKKNPPSQNH